MKNVFVLLVASMFVTACAQEEILGPNEAIARRSVQIVNNRNAPIVLVYGTDIKNGSWGYDRLGHRTIFSGHAVTLSFTDSQLCTYDLRAEFDDGEVVDNRKVNICEISQWIVE